MANNYFQFKQFTIHQDKCAMKVCTDACLFGAYIANELKQLQIKNILDIGSGTGLLSLMLAQKIKATIDTVEINKPAFEQAKENIIQSPWKENITIYNSDITLFKPNKKYDFIISNPPFFEADLKSDDEKKNAAKHDSSLTFMALLTEIDNKLNKTGFFSVLLPWHRTNYFETESLKFNFYLIKKLLVKQTNKYNYFRAILIFSTEELKVHQSELTIKDEEGNYTTGFTELLKDYYLSL